MLIKPLASMLESYPNIYEVGVTCVEVHFISSVQSVLNARTALNVLHAGRYRQVQAPQGGMLHAPHGSDHCSVSCANGQPNRAHHLQTGICAVLCCSRPPLPTSFHASRR